MKKIVLISILLSMVFLLSHVPLAGREDLAGLLNEAGGASDFPGSSHLAVFDRTTVKMMDSGLSHVNTEILYKVLTIDGAKELKSLIFGYDPLSAHIEIKGAKIIKACGKEIAIPLDSISDYPAPARAIYWGAREKLLPVGRLEPGDGVWVETYKKGFTLCLLQKKN